MAITLANLLVKVRADTGTLVSDLKKVGRQADKLGRRVGKTEIPVRKLATGLAAVGAAGAGIAFVSKQVFDLAAAVEETGSKYRTTLGPALEETNDFIERNASLMGLSRREAEDTISTVAAMAQGFGLNANAAADLAKDITRLGADLTSFHNLQGGTAEGAMILAQALTGERERLKRLGVVIREVEVQQRALTNTGKDNVDALTQAEKAIATYQLAVERAGPAVGDLTRTQDSAANTARRIGARFEDVRDTVATGVMPVLEDFLPVLDQLATKAQKWAAETRGITMALLEMAGIADQEAATEIAGITARLREMDEAQQETFLTERLKIASQEYATLNNRVREIQERLFETTPEFERQGKTISDMTNKAVEELQDKLETTGSVMEFISNRLSGLGDDAATAADGVDMLNDSLTETVDALTTLQQLQLSFVTARGPSAMIPAPGVPRGRIPGRGRFSPNPFPNAPFAGESPKLREIDQAVRGVTALADASGMLSDGAADAARGVSDLIGGLQGLKSGNLGIAGQIGSGLGFLSGALGVFQGIASIFETELSANTRALHELNGTLAGQQSLLQRRFDALDIEDPMRQFDALRETLLDMAERGAETSFFGSEEVRRFIEEQLGGITQENVGQKLAEFIDILLAGGQEAQQLADVLQLAGIDINDFLNILSEMERLGDETKKTADAMADLTGVFNAAKFGFKFDAARFQARDFDTPGGAGGGSGGTGGPGGSGGGDVDPIDVPGEPTSANTFIIQIDGRTLFEIMEAEARSTRTSGGTTVIRTEGRRA